LGIEMRSCFSLKSALFTAFPSISEHAAGIQYACGSAQFHPVFGILATEGRFWSTAPENLMTVRGKTFDRLQHEINFCFVAQSEYEASKKSCDGPHTKCVPIEIEFKMRLRAQNAIRVPAYSRSKMESILDALRVTLMRNKPI